jgi:hypothetical protein
MALTGLAGTNVAHFPPVPQPISRPEVPLGFNSKSIDTSQVPKPIHPIMTTGSSVHHCIADQDMTLPSAGDNSLNLTNEQVDLNATLQSQFYGIFAT